MSRRPMDVRAHVSMVFHLDKCIGCHTCSIACKSVWTDRPGAEYMWWNNVETRPGTGYPARWEDQVDYRGGWKLDGKGKLSLRSQSRAGGLVKLFYNPNQPGLDDYYEPWTYRYGDLFDAPEGDDQPTAVPVSQVTGEPIDIARGPNWDDDLGGSAEYAANDPNLDALTPDERQMLESVERIAMMYLPRICNHCLNPSCVASCPSGAIYKRGEDGIVLIDQDVCRGWRACVTACPYKKTYFNWQTGKSEKCILCYPRMETGQPPACFHACVGRIRYLGVLLYDAARIPDAMGAPERTLVDAQKSALLDPNDPEVIRAAEKSGVSPEMIEAAQASPVWRYVMEWGLALPLHPEFRTMPMLYYVPPLLPVMGRSVHDRYGHDGDDDPVARARLPLKYLASLFSAGNVEVVEEVMRRLVAVRAWQQARLGKDEAAMDRARRGLRASGLTEAQADDIYRLTALCDPKDRFVVPPLKREEAIEALEGFPEGRKGTAGFGASRPPKRGT